MGLDGAKNIESRFTRYVDGLVNVGSGGPFWMPIRGPDRTPIDSLRMVCPGCLAHEAQCWIEGKALARLSKRSDAHPVSFGRLATAS